MKFLVTIVLYGVDATDYSTHLADKVTEGFLPVPTTPDSGWYVPNAAPDLATNPRIQWQGEWTQQYHQGRSVQIWAQSVVDAVRQVVTPQRITVDIAQQGWLPFAAWELGCSQLATNSPDPS